MRIVHVVGARPNFMKAAPVYDALSQYAQAEQVLVHTGQHYDSNMSAVFFRDLSMPLPDMNLEVGSASHAAQTAQVMIRLERILSAPCPDLVLVYGDVNSTLAAALVCAKMDIRVGHVEAGLRSFDRSMPEEINRKLTDQMADLLFTPSADADQNLKHEGIREEKIHLVGNTMIDTLTRLLPQAASHWPPELDFLRDKDGGAASFALVTLHRPANVDDPAILAEILQALQHISSQIPVVFPVHPRTRKKLGELTAPGPKPGLHLTQPIGYLGFLALQQKAAMVVTDSGGIQEETTYLGVPCLTLRENTERPVTVSVGTNILVGKDMNRLQKEADKILAGGGKKGRVPGPWDGRSGSRIAKIIAGQDWA